MSGVGNKHTFGKKNVKERDHLLDVAVYIRIILTYFYRDKMGVDRINLAQDRDKEWALLNTVTELQVA